MNKTSLEQIFLDFFLITFITNTIATRTRKLTIIPTQTGNPAVWLFKPQLFQIIYHLQFGDN